MSYTNADGLRILTNGDDGLELNLGTTAGSVRRVLVVDLIGTEIGSTFGASDITPSDPYIPAGSLILSATIVATTAFDSAGEAATLTIGTYDSAGAAIDADGIDAAVTEAAVGTNGLTVRCDGAHLTTTGYVSVNAYIGAIYGTEAFTSGAGKLYVEYVKV